MGEKYEVSMEIAGPVEMFTRPDTGAGSNFFAVGNGNKKDFFRYV